MKKLVYIILICPLIALGQTLNEDKTSYTEVVDVDANKTEINQKLISWTAEAYKSAQDAIQLNTKDKIIVNGNFMIDVFQVNCDVNDLRYMSISTFSQTVSTSKVPYRIDKSMIIDIKEGKYRLEFTPTAAYYQSKKVSNFFMGYMADLISEEEFILQRTLEYKAQLTGMGLSSKKIGKVLDNEIPDVISLEYQYYIKNKQKWEATINEFFNSIRTSLTDAKEDDW
jgi:hypothetical protein